MLYRVFISIVVFCLSFLFLFVPMFVPNLHSQSSDVYISEIQFDGSTGSEHDKWIEVYNPTNMSKNLSGYSLVFKSGKPLLLDGLSITSSSTLLIVNNVNPTISLIRENSEFGNIVKANLLRAFNSSSNPSIHVQLYNGSNLVSSFIKNETETRGLMGTKTLKKSIEIEQNGSYKLSDSLYFGENNFGTPGRVMVLPTQQTSATSFVVAPISTTIDNYSFERNTKSFSTFESPVISKPNVEPIFQSTPIPVQVDVSKLSEIKLSIPNPTILSGLNKEITFASISKSRFSNSLYPTYSQLPLVLVTIASLIKSSFKTTQNIKKEVQTA
jgi:hypothetical protein